MNWMATALAGAAIAAFAAGSVRAASTSTELSVTVTVVAPGTLAGTDGPPATPDRDTSDRPAPAASAQDAAPAGN